MNPDVPGMALGLFFLGGDPAQVCNAGGPRALDEVRLREGLAAVAALSRAARAARHDDDAVPRGAERAGERRGRQRAGGAFRLRHHHAARQCRWKAVPDVGRRRRRLRRAADRRRHRCGVFRRAGELSGRVPGTGLSGAAAALRHQPRQRRAGEVPRRRRRGARIRGAGGTRGAVDADRQRGEPALGRRRRHARRHRSRGGQSRHAARAEAGAAVGRHRAAARRHPAAGNRRWRRARPSVRSSGGAGAAGCARRLRLHRGGTARLRRGDRRRCTGRARDATHAGLPLAGGARRGGRGQRPSPPTPSREGDGDASRNDLHSRGRYRRHLHRHHAAGQRDRPSVARQDAEHAGRSVGGVPRRRDAGAGRGRCAAAGRSAACCTAPRSPPT